MSEPIENEYFGWLCSKVLERNERNGRMYFTLLGILYKTEFVWVNDCPEDANRASDGIELRHEFLRETYQASDQRWYAEPCSVLEMLIAFCRRHAEFQTDLPAHKWFWKLMANLQLDQFRHVDDSDIPMINRLVHIWLYREYDTNGYGGLFPITRTENDQRYVEILYQFHEYLFEHGAML